jgi:hypothetical protein
MQPKHPWLQKCLEKLEELPQIKTTTTIEPYQSENALADGLLTIYTPQQVLEYIVEIKPNLTLETFPLAIEYLNRLKQRLSEYQRPLLVTDTLSDRVVDVLIEKNIEFLDTTGKIYINNSSVYILLINSSVQNKKSSSVSTITASTLKVSYALLREPKILKAPSQELAEVAGVDLRTVKRSLERLYQLNYLQRQRGGGYRIENYTKLLERWEMGYIENLRSELLIDTFSPIKNRPFSDISGEILEIARPHQLLIGGELGAAIITGYLKPISAVLHIPDRENYRVTIIKLRLTLRLKPDARGSISILTQFGNKNRWNDRELKPVVDPLLIHAELARHPDERLKETASRLYEQHIAKRQRIAEMQ